jgi:hypothetical protein
MSDDPRLILPFEPFTPEEVARVTRCPTKLLDELMENVLPIRRGETTFTLGLDYMGLLAVHALCRYLEEGAPLDRATAVMLFVAGMPEKNLDRNLAAGLTFPVPKESIPDTPGWVRGVMVSPPKTRLGNALNLKTLKGELDARLASVFPKGWRVR